MVNNRRNLKAYVRYDGSGRIIPGGPVLLAKKPKVGNWKEIPISKCCNTTTSTTTQAPGDLFLRLTFDSIENADLLVGDSSNVADWNTFFDLPTYGNPFISVEVVGNEVRLFGGSNIKVKPGLMYDYLEETFLIAIDDSIGCITSVGGDAFNSCYGLISVNLPACTIVYGYQDSPYNDYGGFNECINLSNLSIPLLEQAGDFSFSGCEMLEQLNFPNLLIAGEFAFNRCIGLESINFPLLISLGTFCFADCTSLLNVYLPQLTTAGDGCFYGCTQLSIISIPSCQDLGLSVGDDNVFFNVTGNTITLTVPNALMTCNSGNSDGDIQYLQANNPSVTIITV